MSKTKKIAHIAKDCVACGACTKACRPRAISVDRGLRAFVNEEKCVGCGLCAKTCPADVITVKERSDASRPSLYNEEVRRNEETMV